MSEFDGKTVDEYIMDCSQDGLYECYGCHYLTAYNQLEGGLCRDCITLRESEEEFF